MIPAAIANTFFNAPAISTPNTSSYVYTLKNLVHNYYYISLHISYYLEATTTHVGHSCNISSANDGPDNTA